MSYRTFTVGNSGFLPLHKTNALELLPVKVVFQAFTTTSRKRATGDPPALFGVYATPESTIRGRLNRSSRSR